MGDRFYLDVKCKCGGFIEGAYYAPTCGFMVVECPKCGEVINLENYLGIEAEECASTKEGLRFVKEIKKKLNKGILDLGETKLL